MFSNVKVLQICSILLSLSTLYTSSHVVKEETNTVFQYPFARRNESVKETFFGKEISDPYRQLEDPDSEETKSFVNAQNLITKPFLDGEERKIISDRLSSMWHYEKYGSPKKHGSKYFYSHNSGSQNQYVFYYQDSLTSERKVFIDPNIMNVDGSVAITSLSFTQDGSRVAYAYTESGSDWRKIKFKDIETGEDFPETVEHSKFYEFPWTKDNKGIFYDRFDVDGETDGQTTRVHKHQKFCYHRIGEPQENDTVVAEFPDEPDWLFDSVVSDCGHYLILYPMFGDKNGLLYIADLRKTPEIDRPLEFIKVMNKFEFNNYDYITNEGPIFYFRTNKDASNFHVISFDINEPDVENWKVVVPEDRKKVLKFAQCVDENKIILCYTEDARNVLQVHSLHDGKLQFNFQLPEQGAIYNVKGSKDSSEIFFRFVSFLEPGIIYHYDFAKPEAKLEVFKKVQLSHDFDRDDYIVEQKFYPSRDGEIIPMTIIRRKQDEVQPRATLMYGYGGFGYPMDPYFDIAVLAFIDLFDGVYVFANIRGGEEYGKRWHTEGSLLNKQNVFDDFQAAAEYLIEHNYTTKDQLGVHGVSNGGLLIAACINQRPDLFGAAIPEVGVLDMLRFHKFTIGSAWISEYGSPDEKDHFENLAKYSPLHNVHVPKNETEAYPAVFVMTGDHDNRVSPLHSLKYVASLQYAVSQSNYQTKPILLRVYSDSGHGGGKPMKKKIEETADIFTFIYKTLKIQLIKSPKGGQT